MARTVLSARSLVLAALAVAWAAPATALSLADVLAATLAGNLEVQMAAAAVRGADGAAEQARGAFDPQVSVTGQRSRDRRLLTEAERLVTPELGDQTSAGASLAARVERRLPSGLTLSGSAVSSYTDDRLSRELGIAAKTTRALVLGVKLPLARGSGDGNAAKAILAAAEREAVAAGQEARYQLSVALRETAAAYWDYASRWRQLEISRLGEERTLGLLQELKKLIAADEVPAADLDLALANHAERGNARIAAEQALLEARQVLARGMGLAVEQQERLDQPVEAFPEAAAGVPPALDALRDRALARRQDWLALERRIAALRERLAAARDLARPVVDLSVNLSSNGLREGGGMAATTNPFAAPFAGPALMAQLQVQLPVGNRAALGGLEQVSAQLTEAEIRRQALRDDIGNAVEARLAEVRRAAEALAGSVQIVQLYARTLAHERTKRRLGTATLIDVLNVEDRYFRALLDDVQRRRNYAVALVRLGHEIDGLVTASGERPAVNLGAFTHLSGFQDSRP